MGYKFEKRQRNSPHNLEKNKNVDAMQNILLVQLICAILVTSVIFGVCSRDTKFSNDIKKYYSIISSKDVEVSHIVDVFKRTVKTTFAPIKQNIENNKIGE